MNLIMYNIELEPNLTELFKNSVIDQDTLTQQLLIDIYSHDMFLLDRFIPVDGRYSHLAPPNRLLTWDQVKDHCNEVGGVYWSDNIYIAGCLNDYIDVRSSYDCT